MSSTPPEGFTEHGMHSLANEVQRMPCLPRYLDRLRYCTAYHCRALYHGSHIFPNTTPVAPVAYQVILEPGIGQFREFEPRRVHTRTNS